MHIEKMRIQNFRSVHDSKEITLDTQITFLIGKNEQGKTNILRALESANANYKYDPNDLCYNHDTEKVGDKIPIITLDFILNDDDKKKLTGLNSLFENANSLKFIKYFDSSADIFIDNDLIRTIATNEDINKMWERSRKKLNDVVSNTIPDIRIEQRQIEQSNINYLISLIKLDGGFGKEGTNSSDLETTFYALAALEQYNCIDMTDHGKIAKFVLSRQHNSGGFISPRRKVSDLKFTYYAIEILKMVNELNKFDIVTCANYITSNQNDDGGFRRGPNEHSQIDETYYAVMALNRLGANIPKRDKIIGFVLSTVSAQGGFGTINKAPTIQSTYYAVTILKELDATKEISDKEMLSHINFIFSLEGNSGGFKNQIQGDIDEEATYYAFKFLCEYNNQGNKENLQNIIDYMLMGQDDKGGFEFNGKIRQVFSTYYAIYILRSIENYVRSNLSLEFNKAITKEPANKEEITEILSDLKYWSDNIKNEYYVGFDFGKIHAQLDALDPFKISEKNIEQDILSLLPNIIYFDSIDLIKDNIDIYEYINNKEKYRTFTDLFKLCNLNLENIAKYDVHQRSRIASKASGIITGLVNDSWTQDDITVNVGIDGNEIIVYIKDKMGAHDKPSKRSDGFQWYLSFYINFMAGTKDKYRDCILLIDNTGLLLHPKAQKDLLKTLEIIAANNQIIFTTHSPYLIDRHKLDSIRIIEKNEYEGTQIQEKLHNSKFDSLEPIRAAFGISIGDSLFGSKENVIVEGYSDYCIIEGMAYCLKKRGRNAINLDNVSIISVGGADKVPYYALLVWKEGYKYVIVLDNDNEGRKIAKDIADKIPTAKDHVIKLISDGDTGKDATIEDLIDGKLFNKSVNAVYSKIFAEKLNRTAIKEEELDQTERMQFNRYKKFFRDNNLGDVDKILIAQKIRDIVMGNCEDSDPIDKSTIENFSNLFEKINEHLK